MLVRLSVLIRNKKGRMYAITKLNNYSGAFRYRKMQSKRTERRKQLAFRTLQGRSEWQKVNQN